MKSQIEKLDSIHPDLISAFLTGGECEGIPQDVRLFLQQLQWSAEIFEYERNITRAARKLKLRINAEQRIKIEERTCMERIYQQSTIFRLIATSPLKFGKAILPTNMKTLPSYAHLIVTIKV